MSIRTRLLLFALLVTLLAASFVSRRFVQERDRDIALVTGRLAAMAAGVSNTLVDRIHGTEQLHFGLARARDLDTRDRAACSAFLSGVRNKYPQYTGILTIDRDGKLFCDSLETGRSLDLSDRDYFRRASVAHDSIAMQPAFGRLSNAAVLQIAYPVRGESGELKFVLLASLNLQQLAQTRLQIAQMPGAEVVLLDHSGLVLASAGGPAGRRQPGTSIAGSALMQFAGQRSGARMGELPNPDGSVQVWALADPLQVREAAVHVLVGYPQELLVAAADRRLMDAMAILAVVAMLAFIGIWIFVEIAIRRPIATIADMVKRLGRNESDARIVGPLPRGELGVLMDVLNRSAEAQQAVITERKGAEAALRASESEFRALAECMPQIVWMTRPDGWNIYFNQRWSDYTGLTLSESAGQGWNKPFHPQDQQPASDAWQLATTTASTYTIECRLRRADGEYRWWLLRGVPELAPDGTLVKWVGTCTDIHDLKLAEIEISRANRELQQQQNELRVLFDLMPALIMFKDTENRILRINRRGAEAEGLRIDEIEGRSALEIYPETGEAGYLADLEVIRTGQAQFGVIQKIQTRLGREMWVQRDRVPYRDDTGEVVGIVLMAQDVSERKRDQEALQELNADLEARVTQRTAELDLARSQAEGASKAKSEFLASMSHEIRTPMSGLLGLLELLELSPLDTDQQSTLGLARESGLSLLSIIDDILDFSKIEADRLDLNLVASSVREIVENAGRLHAQIASRKNLILHVSVDPAISPLLALDPLRLGQILNNFLNNAIKFTERGSVEVAVERVARRQEIEELRFVVRDTGIGMSAQQLGRIFQPFVQADAETSNRFGGTGLGLVIARRLAELMGGAVELESEAGRGTTVTLTVALEVCDASVPIPASRSRRDMLESVVAQRRRAPSIEEATAEGTLLLVVDDHPTNRRVLLHQAAALGYAAEAAADGVQALALWRSGRFGAVITDCNMPRMNGYQLAAEIRAVEQRTGQRRIPIIACTANALQSATDLCIGAGMDDCMVKPADLAKIGETMDRWLPLARAGTSGPAAGALPVPDSLSAANAADGLLDTRLLAEISGGNAAATAQILADFRRSNERDAETLRHAAGRGDFAPVMEFSHRIKGATSMVGATQLSQACGRIEAAAAARHRADLQLAMGSFETELLRLNSFLDTLT
ncbi:MAG: sensor histidine kinase [Ramlibacter sp.]|nr:sensor histidine kinase [Ramlibacter sp.]